MKNIFRNTILIASIIGAVSCQEKLDENSREAGNAAYMSLDKVVVNVDRKAGGDITIEPRMAALSSQDEKITVSLEDFLAKYNKANATNFRMLPSQEVEMYEVDNPENKSKNGNLTVTVKAGKISSKIKVRVKALDAEKYPLGVKYAIPVEISSTSLGKVLSNKQSLITLQRPVVTSVAHVRDGFAPKIVLDPKIPETREFSYQVYFMFDEFRSYDGGNYNMSLISHGWYSRINSTDVNLSDTQKIFSSEGVQIKTGHWYQVTYTYKDQQVKIYLNGKHIRTFVRPNVVLKGGSRVSIFNPQMSYSVPHIVREIRFWNKALNETQINADLYNPIDPETEGLLVYIPIDSQKNGYKDITKYNNVVELYESTSKSKRGIQDGAQFIKLIPYEQYGIDRWIDNVIFPSETLTQVEP